MELLATDSTYQKRSSEAGNSHVNSDRREFELPGFTIKQIRSSIPPHCFERSALTGLCYVIRDFFSIVTVFILFVHYVSPDTAPSSTARIIIWIFYSAIQGLFGTGLWVLGHECGHQAFSQYELLNDTVGWICHSFLLVPYFSFKITHRQHHQGVGDISRDMGFVPKTKDEFAAYLGRSTSEFTDLIEEVPFITALNLLLQQLFGWPLYLLTNITSNDNHDRRSDGRGKGKFNGFFGGVNHFSPDSPLFESKHAKMVLLSDLGIFIMMSLIYCIGSNFGWMNVLIWYGMPYFWVNHWIAAITYLQHTDASVPHYQPEAWTFIRGATATVDRDLGFIGCHLFHRATDTHVLHHFVSTIPFYHAKEATEAIKKVMGQHYHKSDHTGFIGFMHDLWMNQRVCQWVESLEDAVGKDQGILFFRNHNGIRTFPERLRKNK